MLTGAKGNLKTIAVRDLRAGDYVIAAKAVVVGVDCFGPLAIVDFADGTATPPIPSNTAVEIGREDQHAQWQ
jgi:hypothetical protein